jgi:Tfp pilus assembly protein PilX
VYLAVVTSTGRSKQLWERGPRPSVRGSAIITVLVLAAATAVIASGFLIRSAQEARLATRSFNQAIALNLAEAGVEEALFAANTGAFNSANGWQLASGSTTDYVKSITTGFDFQQTTGAIYLRADNANGASPVITATSVVTVPNQPKIIKQVRIGATTPGRLFANGIVSKGNVTFSGSADLDSYDSSVGAYNSATNRSDRATLAALGTVQISGSATVYGYVATSGTAPNVGGAGRIYGATSPASPKVDPSRVRTDFSANLLDATAPTGTTISLGTLNSSLTLPRGGDAAGASGRYLYRASAMELNGVAVLTINGPVDLIVDADATVNGSAKILINSGSTPSLNLYCAYNVTLNGAGMVNNTGNPAKTTIWGTKASTGTQTIDMNGSASFIGTIYAPNGNVTLNGAAGVFGAVIGKAVTVSGSGDVHYDVQLAQAAIAGGPNPAAGSSSGALRVRSWSELTERPGSGDAFARDNREPFASLF